MLESGAETGHGAGELRAGEVGFDGRAPAWREPWRKLYQDGSLSAVKAGEEGVPVSAWAGAFEEIRELWLMLGKTMENEILR